MGSFMLRGGTRWLLFCASCAVLSGGCDSELPELFPEGGRSGGSSGAASGGTSGRGSGASDSGGGLAVAGTLSAGGGASGAGGTPDDDPGEGGGGGARTCDDANVCTEDRALANGSCTHLPVRCETPGPCRVATCDRTAGRCVVASAPDGSTCDDGRSCTSKDACNGGVCMGTLPAIPLRADEETTIPDGLPDCAGGGDGFTASFEVEESGTAGAVIVELELTHPELSELEILVRHDPSGNTASIRSRRSRTGVSIDGVYTFTDAGTPYPEDLRDALLEPGAYRSLAPLSTAFAGTTTAGTWTLTILDHCEGGVGRISAVRIWIDVADC